MNKISLFLAYFLLYIHQVISKGNTNPSGMTLDMVEIHSVSTRIDILDYAPKGSIKGGTMIYLKAYGHNITPSKNRINVGPYPCPIAEKGISGNIISCMTTEAFDPNQRSSLPVELFVVGKQQSKCKAKKCVFTYTQDATPFLNFITPSAGVPNQMVTWNALWRVSSTGDIKKLKIGDQNCNRFELQEADHRDTPTNLNDDVQINDRSNVNVPCQISEQQTAGLYQVDSETVWGNLYKYAPSSHLTADGEHQYDFAVAANIEEISSNLSGNNGNRLKITGKGFGTNTETVTVNVGALNCHIKELSNEEIICDLAAGDTDGENPGQYLQGQGALYTKYRLSESLPSSLPQFSNANIYNGDQLRAAIEAQTIDTNRIVEQKITSNWESVIGTDEDDGREGVHVRGYFKAPRTGTYKFWLSADDNAEVFLNQTPMTATISDSDNILSKCGWNYQKNYFSPNECGGRQENGQILQKDSYYWLELFAVNNGGPGHFTLSVETPPPADNTYWSNAVDEIQSYQLVPTKDTQKYSIKMFNSDKTFQFSFTYTDPKTRKKTLDAKTDAKTWQNWTPENLVSQINRASQYHGGELIESYALDASGNRCADPCSNPQGLEVEFEFTLYRTPGKLNQEPKCSQGNAICQIKKTQEQSSPLSGTYQLQLTYTSKGQQKTEFVEVWEKDSQGNWDWRRDIPYNKHINHIKKGLVRLDAMFEDVQVSQSRRAHDGHKFIFNFRSDKNKGDIPQFTIDLSNLEGGKAAPTVDQQEIVSASKSPFYEPVPFDMSYTKADYPNVMVKVNNIQSVCSAKDDGCKYQTDASKTPVLNSFSVASSIVTLNIDTSFDNTVTKDHISIWYAGYPCEITNIDLTALTCTVAGIEAGENTPKVLVEKYGFASYSGSPESVNLVVSSLSPNTGSTQGGREITITGTGFPQKKVQAMKVKFGTISAQILSSSNTEIKVVLPVSGNGATAQAVTVEFNGKTSNNDVQFTYDDTGIPTITSIVIDGTTTISGQTAQVNPVKKQKITVNGANYGADISKLSLWLLKDGEQVYEININELNNGNEILATLGGGHVGDYKLRVYHDDLGYSAPLDFSYIIEISSFTPTQGAKQGGQKLTITGINFSEVISNNQVFIEQQDGTIVSQATILTATKTQLEIRIPPMPSNGNISQPFLLTVFGRIIEQATCTDSNSCAFTYQDNIQVPSITIPTTLDFDNGQELIIAGTNLPTSADTAKILTNGKEYPLNLDSATQFSSFTIPNDLSYGAQLFQVHLDSFGVIGAFQANINLSISEVLPTDPISTQGTDITVNGNGFTEESEIFIEKDAETLLSCVIRQQTTTQIICTAPPLPEARYHVILQQPTLDDTKCSNCIYYKNSQTPKVLTSTPLSKNSEISAPSSAFTYTILTNENLSTVNKVYLQSKSDPKTRIQSSSVSESSGQYTVTFNEIIAGNYQVMVLEDTLGYAMITPCSGSGCDGPAYELSFTLDQLNIVSGQDTGLAGGTELVLSGQGFNTQDSDQNIISICGQICEIQDVTLQQISCILPKINTKYVYQQDFETSRNIKKQSEQKQQRVLLNKFQDEFEKYAIQKITTSETGEANVKPSITQKPVKKTTNTNEFWIKLETRPNIKLFIEKITLDPGRNYDMDNYYGKVKLQARNSDSDTWKTLDTFTADHISDVQELNLIVAKSDGENTSKSYIKNNLYKQFRILETQESDQIALSELFIKDITGTVFYETDIDSDADFTCPVEIQVNDQETTISGNAQINYQGLAKTAIVTNISPSFSTIQGGDTITITGSKFGTTPSSIKVEIDGEDCPVDSVIDTEIQCTTQPHKPIKNSETLKITKDTFPVLYKNDIQFYTGALLWSHVDTWGGEAPPRDGDTIFVPKGQTLVVDESGPKIPLKLIVVEGTLLFDPDLQKDLTLDAEYIIVRGGKFLIGQENKRYQNQLIITLHGNFWGKQLPEFGNKVLACHNCQLDLFAEQRGPHMAFLKNTVSIGAQQLVVNQEVQWKVGDRLGIATTDYNGSHSEEIFITSITNSDGEATIGFQPPLKYQHLAEQETFGSKTLDVSAEIILLSSNVVIQGNPKDSIKESYGGHLMIHGKAKDGTLARIDGVEFRHTGQPRIIGRYTCHFHMLGDAPDSYVRNIKVHSAYARVVAVHASNYLKIQNNVGFFVPGHNIFLEDGIETNNLIEGNVLISPRSAFTMLQTDITVAGVWSQNPSNYIRKNRVAGSQFYGIWYEIKEHPESRSDMCPQGMPVLELSDNVGHSCQRFGLRFFNLRPRKYPCKKERDPTAENPFEANPSIKSTFRNQISYKNGESGILAEFIGNSVFENCIMADNYRSGFQSHTANFTAEPVVLQDSLIVGKSTINGETVDFESCAILLPRTDGFLAKNIEIHNFPVNTNIIESSSENQFKLLWVQGGYQNKLENLQIHNSADAGIIKYQGPRQNLLLDKDGSLTGKNVPTWIAPYKAHYDKPIADGECERKINKYDDSIVCTIPLRAMKFGNLENVNNFIGQKLRIFNLNDETKVLDVKDGEDSTFGDSVSMLIKNPKKDYKYAYVGIFAVDYTYNLHWNQGMDWSHLLAFPSYETQESDKTIILRFPYWEQRELYDVFRMVGGQLTQTYHQVTDLTKFVDPTTQKPNNSDTGCVNGDWYQDTENNQFYLCINGKGRDNITHQQIDINGVYCRDTCPTEGFDCEKESKIRNFLLTDPTASNKQYINEDEGAKAMAKAPGTDEWQFRVPQEGDDVKIPCEYSMLLNVASFTFNNLIIDGTLRIDPSFPKTTIKATNIWIRGGKLVAGYPEDTKRFDKQLEIILTGNRESENLFIDDISRTGTKSLAVTGKLELYGIIPKVTRTRLAQTVDTGATSIVLQDDISDWQIGDEIALGSGQHDGLGYEKVKIASKDDTTKTITLENPIQFWHYGHQHVTVGTTDQSEVKIDKKYGGDLDLRCAVGHLTRNIKIKGNLEDSEWGGHLQVYHYIYSDESIGVNINARGQAIIEGVEFHNMGQRGSDNGGIHILHTDIPVEDPQTTRIIGSSMADCIGICVNGYMAEFVKFDNNIFYNARRFHIQALETKHWTVTNNYLLGVNKRKSADIKETKQWDPTAFMHMYTRYLPSTHHFDVRNNVGQGSEGVGFVFPGTPCEEKEQVQFVNNEAGHCVYTGILFNQDENKCYHVGHVAAHNCAEGVTLNSGNVDDGYDAANMRIAECSRNLELHAGSSTLVLDNFLKNTWVSALVRPTCEDCYTEERQKTHTRCKNQLGIQLHVTTNGGETFPWVKSPFSYDVICSAPNAFGSSYISDSELHNFRDEYNASDFPHGSKCSGNRGFKNKGSAASATAGTYLSNVKCTNCEKDGYIFIAEPREKWRGWFGGCGNMDCTGLENVLVQDLTGHLLGHIGSIVSNNEPLFTKDLADICTFYAAWNAYDCVTTDFGVLEWQAISPDKQKLSPAPVMITNSHYTNTINMWREWAWQGPEPLNERLNRFVSLISINQEHNITYSGTKCTDIVHKLQQRTPEGEENRFIIVKYHYSSPLALEVKVGDTIIPSFPSNNYGNLMQDHTTTCGANNYFFANNTIHFVITNVPSCQVRVYQKNFLKVNLRISMTPEEFYSNEETQTNFIDTMASFLGIDFNRIRIVGVSSARRRQLQESSGGSQIDFIVTGDQPGDPNEGYDAEAGYLSLRALGEQISRAADTGEGLDGLGFEVQGASFEVTVVKEAGMQGDSDGMMDESDLSENQNQGEQRPGDGDNNIQDPEEKDGNMVAIAIGIIVGLVVTCSLILVGYHFWKKKQIRQIHNNEILQDDDQQSPQGTPKNLNHFEGALQEEDNIKDNHISDQKLVSELQTPQH